MTLSIQEIYDYAKLTTLSYVDLSAFTNKQIKDDVTLVIKTAQEDKAPGNCARIPNALGIQMLNPSDTISADVTGKWTVLDPYFKTSPESGHSDPASGFAAILVENATYGKVLAIAGTEPSAPGQIIMDGLFADLQQIGSWGIALEQLVSLYNYVQVLRGTGKVDQLVLKTGEAPPAGLQSFCLVPEDPVYMVPGKYLWIENTTQVDGRNLISATEKLSVTGHSLGGHLAALAVALFPDFFESAVTFNAPGYNPPTSRADLGADNLLGLFTQFGVQPNPVSSIADRVATFESEDAATGDDYDVVSGRICGTPFSPETFLTVERNTHNVGHSMDGLAMSALLYQLDSSLTLDVTNGLVKAASSRTSESYEQLLGKVHQLIKGGTMPSIPESCPSGPDYTYDDGSFVERSSFYDTLIALVNSPEFSSLVGNVTVQPLFDITRANDKATLTAFTADRIVTLAQTDIAARYALVHLNPFIITGNDALYAQHNTNGELDLVNPTTGQGLSKQYLKDRAKFLALKNELAVADRPWQETIPSDMHGYYEDRGSQFAINNTYNATRVPAAEYIFGTDNADVIESFRDPRVPDISFNDHMFGGGGNDIIRTHAGNDYLEGGAGQDSMDGGAGDDTFHIAGTDADYDIFQGGEGLDTILGSAGDDTIRLHRFTGEDTVEVIDGGEGVDVIAGTDGADLIDLTGTSLDGIERIEGGLGADTILGSMGNDTIHGGEGGDVITGNKGDDLLVGGPGRDVYVYAEGDGHDTIVDSGDNLIQLRLADGSIVPVGDFFAKDASTWESADGRMRLVHNTTRKILMPGGGSIDLGAGFTEGDHGIRLINPTPSALTLTGTANRDEMGFVTYGSNPANWELYFASFPPNNSSTVLFQQQLPSTAPRMHITGGASGGFLFGFQSRDEIYGGDGGDILSGDGYIQSNNRFFITLDNLHQLNVTFTTSVAGYHTGAVMTGVGVKHDAPDPGHDVLNGGAGNDMLFGGAGHDTLSGGVGHDALFAGAGDDCSSHDPFFLKEAKASV